MREKTRRWEPAFEQTTSLGNRDGKKAGKMPFEAQGKPALNEFYFDLGFAKNFEVFFRDALVGDRFVDSAGRHDQREAALAELT